MKKCSVEKLSAFILTKIICSFYNLNELKSEYKGRDTSFTNDVESFLTKVLK